MNNVQKNQEDIEAINILVKNILAAIKQNNVCCDRTYKSVIKSVTSKGYVVLDLTGNERTVKCCIPNISLKVGQNVWLKEPMGNLNNLHICGVV